MYCLHHTDTYSSTQTHTHLNRHTLTSTDTHSPVQTHTNQHRPTLTSTDTHSTVQKHSQQSTKNNLIRKTALPSEYCSVVSAISCWSLLRYSLWSHCNKSFSNWCIHHKVCHYHILPDYFIIYIQIDQWLPIVSIPLPVELGSAR